MAAADPQFSSRINSIREKRIKSTIMFIGAPGAGKSSLINSLVNVMDPIDESSQQGLDKYVPTAPPDLMGGHTMMREAIQLTDSITIIDNRGWQDWGNEIALKELAAQINGERSFVDKVDWEKGGEVFKKVSGMPLVVAEKITCIAVVINGKGGVDALQDFKKLIRTCNDDTGRIPTVVVTHKDEMSTEELEKIQSTLEKVYGINKGRIFIIRNMTETNTCIEDESKSRLLDFLDRCVADAKKATEFHDKKEKLMAMILESQKEVEAEEKKKQKTEEAESAAREEEVAAREVAAAAREVEVEKLIQEKVRLGIDTNRQKALAEIEEKTKREEQKHAQKMNREKEESYVKMQETVQAHTVEEHSFKTQREKTLAEIEENKKRDELEFSLEMNKLARESVQAAQEKANEQKNKLFEKQMALIQIEEDKERDNLAHQTYMHKNIQENWLKLEQSRQNRSGANLANNPFLRGMFSQSDSK